MAYKKGDKIIFVENIIQEANSESPQLLLAFKHSVGFILRQSNFTIDGWIVKNEFNEEFRVSEKEFKKQL